MSAVPLINAGLTGICLVSILMWELSVFLASLSALIYVSLGALLYICKNSFIYPSAFIMFLGTEILAFGTLLFCVLSTEPLNVVPLSDNTELPLLGSIILLSSSLTITTFHHTLGLSSCRHWLLVTIALGFCFIGLQVFEFWESESCLGDTYYHSCCFSVVGLHCSHVLLGIIGMLYVNSLYGKIDGFVNHYYSSIVVWYWHFVDYVWLFVYIIVYC